MDLAPCPEIAAPRAARTRPHFGERARILYKSLVPMSARAISLPGLFGLDRLATDDRRGAFRQGFASLAALAQAKAGDDPLEGHDPEALARSMRVALDVGLLDDLGWLAPPSAGVALYEIAGALPNGPEKRDLGRRVLGQLYEG